MPTSRKDTDPADPLVTALTAAETAGERFADAKTEMIHRLADVDEAMVQLVQRVYDTTPPEFQRTFSVSIGSDEPDELTLPDFVRLLVQRGSGTEGTFAIAVTEDLYDEADDEGDDDDGSEEDDD